MKKLEICKKIKQPTGYTASVPCSFPQKGLLGIPQDLINKSAEAERIIGKLDGITETLPDIDFFLRMFAYKDASSSSQIEGTQATMADALELSAEIREKDTDAYDIIFYIRALDYGIKRLKEFPLSLRFIKELHENLMEGARSSHFSSPGEFRKTQNWIGGTNLNNASFVPPPVEDMNLALNDFEKFLYDNEATLPIVSIAYAHAQFETIHPFLDGNGRTGRLLITFLLIQKNLLEKPVLFLSSFFKEHKKIYYDKLNEYHSGNVHEWLEFFLDGVIEIGKRSIEVSKKIRKIRDIDMEKIQALAKRESNSSMKVLQLLFSKPILTSKSIMKETGFTRAGAQQVIDRLVKLDILVPREQESNYDRKYVYERYFNTFIE